MFQINPLLSADAYKLAHRDMYDAVSDGGLEYLQSNFTPRTSRIAGIDHIVVFGVQAYVQDLADRWDEGFFDRPWEDIEDEYTRFTTNLLGAPIATEAIKALHDLGYLPLKIRAMREGTLLPLRVPMVLVENTDPRFAWLVNYIETDISASLWHPCTSATQAYHFRKLLDSHADVTGMDRAFVDWQGHDFSARGMVNMQAAAASGAGHLLSFAGTDSLPSIQWIEYYYGRHNNIGGSVPATEHSVMCVAGKVDEVETFRALLERYPTGIISIVADTWDLWKVIIEYMVELKDLIMARDGKVVIRPDSGNPVDIICGDWNFEEHGDQCRNDGVIKLLWDRFGGTVTSKGFKLLDSHVGVIYGDAITYPRAAEIGARLAVNGFAMQPVLGVGSFTYQYVTRDTFGFAMKATYAVVDGEERDLFKDPVTDSGTKRSAKGRLAVHRKIADLNGADPEYVLVQQATMADEEFCEMVTVYVDGAVVNTETFETVVERLGARVLVPTHTYHY